MSIQQNIKRVNDLILEMENHPCCLDYNWDNVGRLTVIFPEGYFYGVAQGIRLNENKKSECLKKAIVKLEEVWELNK